MSDYVRPTNPFPVSEAAAEMTHGLINAAVETFAIMAVPIHDQVEHRLILAASYEWAKRITSLGNEDACHVYVWELSTWIERMSQQGIPFPPFDITTTCGDDECTVDHSEQIRLVNTLFASGVTGQHQDAVKAYTAYTRKVDPGQWSVARAQYAAMLAVHVSERVCDFRTQTVDVMPSLEDLPDEQV